MGIKIRNLDEQDIVLVAGGTQAAGNNKDIDFAGFRGFISNIYAQLDVDGADGSQISDIHKNGVTIFTNAPKLTHGPNVGAAVFTGGGLNDATAGGNHTANQTNLFEVEIDATGTPDTFKWRKNGGAYTAAVAITGSAQTLSDGVTITFAATTGHTLANKWAITAVDARVASVDAVSAANQLVAKGDKFSLDVDSVHSGTVGQGLAVHIRISKRSRRAVGSVAPSALV